MRDIKLYILEKKKEKEKDIKLRSNIKFTIWKQPDLKVQWLKDNEKYQKIEYKYEDNTECLFIDFLLGFKDDTWYLWVGKIGSCSYDDDPYKDLKTSKFSEAIIAALDAVEEFINNVKEEPDNYVQFYTNL